MSHLQAAGAQELGTHHQTASRDSKLDTVIRLQPAGKGTLAPHNMNGKAEGHSRLVQAAAELQRLTKQRDKLLALGVYRETDPLILQLQKQIRVAMAVSGQEE